MTVYVVCAILGGLLILVSLLGHDHSGGVDHDIDPGSHDLGHFLEWFPILSLRFWAFALGAFGLSGVLLIKVAGLSATAAFWTSVLTGVASGLAVMFTLRALMRHSANAMATEDDLRGMEATVTVAIRGSEPGRIRCFVKGDLIDLLAVSGENSTFELGVKVVIVDIENDRAKVVARDALLSTDALEVQNS